MDLKAFKAKKKELTDELAKNGRKMLVEEFKSFFADHPEVEALRWTQYTPYFNDGEPCEFNRHDFEVKGNFPDQLKSNQGAGDGDGDEGFYEEWDIKDGSAIDKGLSALTKKFAGTDDVFQASFGDGVQVVCTRKGFTVEEYDHD